VQTELVESAGDSIGKEVNEDHRNLSKGGKGGKRGKTSKLKGVKSISFCYPNNKLNGSDDCKEGDRVPEQFRQDEGDCASCMLYSRVCDP